MRGPAPNESLIWQPFQFSYLQCYSLANWRFFDFKTQILYLYFFASKSVLDILWNLWAPKNWGGPKQMCTPPIGKDGLALPPVNYFEPCSFEILILAPKIALLSLDVSLATFFHNEDAKILWTEFLNFSSNQ